MGLSYVLDYEDMSNAFGSTDWNSLTACLLGLVLEEDEGCVKQKV